MFTHLKRAGRELFGVFRASAAGAEQGAMTFSALEVAETGKPGD